MPRAARRYDLYLPLADNDGRPFADDLFRAVQRRLLDRFGGLTSQQRAFPFEGMWQNGARLFLDQVIVMTVLDFRRLGSTRFIAQIKQALLREFEQLEILITEQPLRVH
jgi:inorganic pyrophosphatase